MKIRNLILTSLGLVLLITLAYAFMQRQGVANAASPQQGSDWKRWQLTGSGLNGVDATGPNDAWTVGSDGTLAHWDGVSWTAYDNTKLGTMVFNSVDMVASNMAWSVASGGKIFRYNGSSWVEETSNNGSTTLYDVSMASATDGWAVGSNARFVHYDGTDWQVVAPGGVLTTTMYGVDMVSASLGWAVGGASDNSGILGKIARWDGTSWQVVYTGNRILYSIDMLDSNNGWAAGQGGTLLRWDGTNWNLTSSPSGAVTVDGVATISPTDAWAVGATNGWTNNVWHWDGTSWTPVSTPNGAPLNDIVMLSASDGWIVGERGTVYRYNGSAWGVSNTHFTTNGFYGLDFLTPNDGWAVGVLNSTTPPAYGLQHWNGTDWEIYQPPFFQPTMYDVGMVASNAVWAVGTSGYVFKWNGATWTRDTSPADAHLYAMSMISATNGWAVGSSGRIVHYDGTAWTNYTSNTTTNLWSIDMVNENEGWAGGTLGLMLHYQSGTWTPLAPNPASFTIEGIHMLNANEGWAVGYSGTILHYLNGTWSPQASPTTQNLLNVHMVNSNEGWAVGAAPSGGMGTLLHYQNGTWSLVPNPTGKTLRDIYVFGTGEGWTVSEAPGAKLYLSTGNITPTPGQTATPTSVPSTSTAIIAATSTSVPPTAVATSTGMPSATGIVITPSATAACGAAWSVVSSPNVGTFSNAFDGVAAVNASDVWAVGYSYDNSSRELALVQRWNGSSWSVVPAPQPGQSSRLKGVSAISANDVWAVGYYAGSSTQTLIERWNGTQWDVIPSPPTGACSSYLQAVAAIAPNDVWAVGYYLLCDSTPQTLTMHWNGSQWTMVNSPNIGSLTNRLNGVAALSSGDVWAVGEYVVGSDGVVPMALHWNGASWSSMSMPQPGGYANNLFGVTAISANDVWAVGYSYNDQGSTQTLIEHWNGAAWSIVTSPNPGTSRLRGVSALTASDVWAVGDFTNQPLALHWDGAQWGVVPSPSVGPSYLTAVDMVSANDVWAVGNYYIGGSISQTLVERYGGSGCPTPTSIATATSTPSAGTTQTTTSTTVTTPVAGTATQTTLATTTPTACAISFSDVPPDSTFYTWIRCLACRNIISGYTDGTFRPGNDITRGQIAKMVSNSAGFSEDPGPQLYEDVPEASPFYAWINRLSMRGHMGGYPCGLVPEETCIPPDNRPYFRPNASATRGQLAKIVSNAAGLGGDPTGLFYTDVPEEHTFYVWIMRLTSLGVMSGYPCGSEGEPCDDANRPYFRPFNNVTRGQASKIVANTFFPNCQTPQRP
ncbi:MAG TPA: S-layer homology domain-containing protein [Chloroflexia bacterium]|nr:S-layer homology domain-containing protein [Chloroflexia bacterium]